MLLMIFNCTLAMGLFWTCFCRVVRTDNNTEPAVRAAFCVLASVALAVGVAPFGLLSPLIRVETIPITQVLLLAGIVLVQGLTARYWRDGVPPHFQRCVCPLPPEEKQP